MAWSYKKSGNGDAWSIEEPSSKKRKVGKEDKTDDWGDDSLELTQAEIESLDVMASQALNVSEMPDQSTSSTGAFLRPNAATKLSTNKFSSSDSNSSLRPRSSTSSDASSNYLSSHSSSDNCHVLKQPDEKMTTVTDFAAELEKKNQEVRNALDQKYHSDGEVKFLRQSLQKKETEIENLRAQKLTSDNHLKQLKSEKERQLKIQMDKLTSETHFKEREYQERIQVLEKRIKEKDGKQIQHKQGSSESPSPSSHDSVVSKTSSPQKVSVKLSPPSKLKQQRGDEMLSSSQHLEFPTHSSFMEKPLGHSLSPNTKSSSIRGAKTTPDRVHTTEKIHPKRMRMRRLQLTKARDLNSGAEVVSEMIRPSATAVNEGEPGLPGLLHALSTSLTLGRLSYTRNKDSTFLSPLKPQRRSLLPGSGSTFSGESNSVQVVNPDNFHLAIQGLEMLLHDKQQITGVKENVLNRKSHPMTTYAASGGGGLTAQLDTSQPFSGAVLLLPVLSDYLHHYLEMINSTMAKGSTIKSPNTTPVTSNTNQMGSSSGLDSLSFHTGSSSCDSSLDSLSSCVLHLLHEGKIFATALEKYTVSALQCLSLIIQLCPEVTSVLAHSSLNESTSVPTDATSIRSKQSARTIHSKDESGTDADDEKSTSSSEVRIIAGFNRTLMHPLTSIPPHSLQNQSRLLLRVARLAAENLEESSSSPLVVEESLRVLNHLCDNCTVDEVLCLENVIIKDALALTLKQTKHPQVLLQAQELCGRLIHQLGAMAKMCTQSESCPMYTMYRLCADPQVEKLQSVSLQLYTKHISILSNMSQHRTGLLSLLPESCVCSGELIVGTILAVFKLYMAYNKHNKTTSVSDGPTGPLLYPLLQGILLLHCLAQADKAFLQHHTPVQLVFVRLLSGLSTIIAPIRSQWEWHAQALDELCDFEPEFHESSSQDSESDERMDQT